MRKFFFILLFFPGLVLAAPRTFSDLAYMAIDVINGGIGIALILGIVIYFYGATSNMAGVAKGGSSDNLRKHLLWGMIALFVMFSVWGILRLLSNTLFSPSSYTGIGGGGGRGDVICTSITDCALPD